MIKIDLKRHRKEIIGSVVVLLILLGGMSVFKYTSFNSGFEIVDDLGGNIFPSAILSVATTDAQVIVPSDSNYLGNPKSCIAVRVKSKTAYSRVRIEVAETPFFSRSVSEFVLNKPRTEYTIYPDIIWNYEALKNEVQAEPVSVAITVEMNGKDLGQRVRTFSCLLYTSDAADDLLCVDLRGRRVIKKKKKSSVSGDGVLKQRNKNIRSNVIMDRFHYITR